MRKHIKAQLQEVMADFVQTTDGLDQILGGLSGEEAADMLAQMQELMIQVGNTIEASEGEENGIVRKLEAVCELIYRLSNSLDHGEERAAICHQMAESARAIKRDVENGIAVTLEVLFLPYQVSMWDSLESVWMAAREDPNVNCYVVPIPVYDVKPDGSLGMMHYEGDRYPDYVPVVPYWKYSIEDRRPDIIFFHNPYDDTNLVTRVPERYYSSYLKQYTDMLVYIPYFVSETEGPADHQCYSPGVLYADRVVVQPGGIYEKYCRIYTEVIKQNGWEKQLVPAKAKFLPLGSPKFDKIRNISCATENLPKEWQRVIRKSDGSRKKILFYNLSIGAFLQEPEQMLKKIDNVFSYFRKRQEEVVLLWRPHPLLMGTVNSMTPWLREAYMQRIQQFKEEEWGIYDETSDPNLAMALSDGYYGDSSSLLIIYRETGKPILLQDAYILN